MAGTAARAGTNFEALDALHPLPPAELSRQWALLRESDEGPEGWRREALGPLRLFSHPDALVCPLLSREGEPVGWAIQPLAWLSPHGPEEDVACRDGTPATLPVPARFGPEEIEAALYGRDARGLSDGSGFVGNWTAIVRSQDGAVERLHLGATHSVLFDARRRIVATSHNLIPEVERDLELSRAFDPLAANGHYVLGLTPFRGLERLLPNHALNLKDFRPVRHWPPEGGLPPGESAPAAAARMVTQARRAIEAVAPAHDGFAVPLSAGRDSRAVLACLRPFAERSPGRVQLHVTARPGIEQETDVRTARRLAALAGLPIDVRPSRQGRVTPEAVARTFVRIGEARAAPILAAAAEAAAAGEDPAAADLVQLPGMAGETARAYYWPPEGPGPLTPAGLARLLGAPAIPAVEAAAERWLAGLPAAVRDRPADALDLAYVEQRLGSWEASAKYLFPGRRRANLNLMGATLAIEIMLRLPEADRRAGTLQREMVAFGWPALLAPPFNAPTGWLRARRLALELRRRAALRRRAGRLLRSLGARR